MKVKYKLLNIRKEKNISQNELSKKACVGLQSITRIEKGKAQEVSLITLLKLAKTLEVEVTELYEEIEEEN